METQSENEFAAEIAAAPKVQFYGLTQEGGIVMLPLAPYASTALHLYNRQCAEDALKPANFPMIFNDHQYRAVLSAVEAELNDVDGDTLIPTYVVFPFDTLLPVFPHASVDTDEEVQEFIQGYVLEVAGPVKLEDIRANWPKPADAEPVTLSFDPAQLIGNEQTVKVDDEPTA